MGGGMNIFRVLGRSQEDSGLHHGFLLVDTDLCFWLAKRSIAGDEYVFRVWGRSQEDGGLQIGFLLVDTFWFCFWLARTNIAGMNMCQSLRTEPIRWWTTSRFPIGWYILISVSDWLGQALWGWICVRVWGRSQEGGGLHQGNGEGDLKKKTGQLRVLKNANLFRFCL